MQSNMKKEFPIKTIGFFDIYNPRTIFSFAAHITCAAGIMASSVVVLQEVCAFALSILGMSGISSGTILTLSLLVAGIGAAVASSDIYKTLRNPQKYKNIGSHAKRVGKCGLILERFSFPVSNRAMIAKLRGEYPLALRLAA